MLAFPSAVKTRAATPGVPRIPSPTAATIATGRSTAIFSTSWRCSSALNIRSSALFKRSVASSGTTRQIEFSLDDWLIIITDTRSAAAVSNTRAANPGTPLMPAPCTVIMPRPPSDVVAFTTLPSLSVLLGIVGDEETLGGERLGFGAGVVQDCGDDRGGDTFPVGHDRVERTRGALAQDRDALQERCGAFGEVRDLLEDVRRFEAERIGDEVPMLVRESEDRVLGGLRIPALRGTSGADERVGRARGRRDHDDAVPPRVLHDLGDPLQRRRRRHRRAAELQDSPRHALRCAIWITSPSIADAVASPPAPGPLHTKRGTRSLSSVITLVGPVACPSSESAGSSSGPTRAFVALSPKSATAR